MRRFVDQRELFKKRGVGLSKVILIALHTTAIDFKPGSIGSLVEAIEDFEDKVLGTGEPTWEQVRNALNYLRRKKLIEIQKEYQTEVFKLTKLGWWRTRKLLKSFGIKKPDRWDGKWRIVIFDIPDIRKSTAESFRKSLRSLGLANLQKSIWIHPYEYRDQVFYLAEKMYIKPYIRYMVAEEITGGKSLRKRFGL